MISMRASYVMEVSLGNVIGSASKANIITPPRITKPFVIIQ